MLLSTKKATFFLLFHSSLIFFAKLKNPKQNPSLGSNRHSCEIVNYINSGFNFLVKTEERAFPFAHALLSNQGTEESCIKVCNLSV